MTNTEVELTLFMMLFNCWFRLN